ncbi:MAG: hypothetical protein A2146_07000 [Actinobacteria bacterium RBG_16_67_10]|nr:MAG: hypothetical protein A2146_07000 [Actinobacteria bacterium RBG_16_67_10]
MNTQATISEVDPAGKWMYRVSGIGAVILAIGYFLAIPIYALMGDQPAAGVEAQLAYFANHAAGWWSIVVLMVATDLLYVPVYFGLYLALKHLNQGLVALGAAFAAFLFVILDLAVTWTGYSTMIVLGGDYAAAPSQAQQAALVAAAAYPAAILQSPILGTYAIVIPALGALFVGIVMLNGVFSRVTAYLALGMGAVGILYIGSFFIDDLAALRYATGLLAIPFYLLAGIRLYRLGRSSSVG